MAQMDDGQMETVLQVAYGDRLFRKNTNGQLRKIRRAVRRWLNEVVGPQAQNMEVCGPRWAWRQRTLDVNEHHLFIFRDHRDAVLFKLRWG